MRGSARGRRLAAGIAVAMLLVGCGSGPDVEGTEDALGQLRSDLADNPDVTSVITRIDTSTGTASPSMITVIPEANTPDEERILALIHDIARDTWRSAIPSISTLTIEVDVASATASYDTRHVFDELAVRRSTLEEEFGPRP